jgi:CRISPR-associated protein Cas2
MAGHDAWYVVAYDIRDQARLQRLHRYLAKVSIPIQYSVFLLAGKPEQAREVFARCLKIANTGHDDLRIYRLGRHGHVNLGKKQLPCGILLLGNNPGLSDALS